MIRITDPKFKYVPSFATDLKKRFRQIELEQKKQSEAGKTNVTALKRSAK